MSIQGAARILARANVTGAPVVNDLGQCIGVLSATDFMNLVKKERVAGGLRPRENHCTAWQISEGALESTCRVEDLMTHDPVLVEPGTKITELARMMMDAHIHRLIVVDCATRKPIGIVSSMDILAAVARAENAEEAAPGYVEEEIC
jgi:predicted transcriptional regulator